jgi:hypothetical protein
MSNDEIHTKEDQALIASKLGELMELCINLNSEHFTCFFEFSGHIQQWEIKVYQDGYHTSTSSKLDEKRYVRPFWASADQSIEDITEIVDCLNEMKSESDEKWSPKNQALAKSEAKERKINAARKHLASLEAN